MVPVLVLLGLFDPVTGNPVVTPAARTAMFPAPLSNVAVLKK